MICIDGEQTINSNAIRLVVPVRKSFLGARSCTCRCPQKQLRVRHDEEPGEPVVPEKPPLDSSHDRRSHRQYAPAYFFSFFAPPLVLAVPRNSFILFLRCLPVTELVLHPFTRLSTPTAVSMTVCGCVRGTYAAACWPSRPWWPCRILLACSGARTSSWPRWSRR